MLSPSSALPRGTWLHDYRPEYAQAHQNSEILALEVLDIATEVKKQFDLEAENGARVGSCSPKFVWQRTGKIEKVREIIRFGWGTTTLGDFIIAVSGQGIVALEFSASHLAMEDALRIRFPDASFELSQTELGDVIAIAADAIDDSATELKLPLDLRGTPYEIKVWNMLRDIPASQTTYYGELAARLSSRDPREVTAAIANNPIAVLIPCHRVIKKDGSISGYRWGVQRKRALFGRRAARACGVNAGLVFI